jgi:hypothetical protein
MPKCQRMPFFPLKLFILQAVTSKSWTATAVFTGLKYNCYRNSYVGFLTLDDFIEITSNPKTHSTACINGELQRALRDQSNIYKFAFLSNETLEFDAISTVQQCFAILYVFVI